MQAKNAQTGECLRLSDTARWLRTHNKPVPQVISKEQREEYRKCFDMIDVDGEGTLSADELHTVLKASGDKISLGEVKKALQGPNGRNAESITYGDFEEIMSQQQQSNQGEDDGTESANDCSYPLATRLQTLAVAYRRRQLLEGVMLNKNNWRATFIERSAQQQEEARAEQDTQQEAALAKAKAEETRKRMFGTLRPTSPNGATLRTRSPGGSRGKSRSPSSPGRSRPESPDGIDPVFGTHARSQSPRPRSPGDGKRTIAFGSSIRLGSPKSLGYSPGASLGQQEAASTSPRDVDPWSRTTWIAKSVPKLSATANSSDWWATLGSREDVRKRLEETFGQGSLPSDAAVSKSIKAASKRKNWTNDYAQGNDRGPSGMPGYNLGRRDAIKAARARQSTPVAAELWRNLHATRMIRQEMEALTNALA